MNKIELIKKIMALGVEIDRTDDRVQITMAINDAEIILDRFLTNSANQQLQGEVNVEEMVEKYFKLINDVQIDANKVKAYLRKLILKPYLTQPSVPLGKKVVDTLSELVDLVESHIEGDYEFDSFSLQPAKSMLFTLRNQKGVSDE